MIGSPNELSGGQFNPIIKPGVTGKGENRRGAGTG